MACAQTGTWDGFVCLALFFFSSKGLWILLAGSGKTAAFLIPSIEQLMVHGFKSAQENVICPHTLILFPTRELTAQISLEARRLSYLSFIKNGVITGGQDLAKQLMDVGEKCAILIATPGRLLDILARGKLTLMSIKVLILDEADRMLDMGFEPQIRQIVQQEGTFSFSVFFFFIFSSLTRH